jgi:hypothetical protein
VDFLCKIGAFNDEQVDAQEEKIGGRCVFWLVQRIGFSYRKLQRVVAISTFRYETIRFFRLLEERVLGQCNDAIM